jgi:hypothetical protein
MSARQPARVSASWALEVLAVAYGDDVTKDCDLDACTAVVWSRRAAQNSSSPPTWPMVKMWRVAAQMVSSVWIGVPSAEYEARST